MATLSPITTARAPATITPLVLHQDQPVLSVAPIGSGRPTLNLARPAPSPAGAAGAHPVRKVNADPMMALIAAAHERTQIALEDLSGQADDQKACNEQLKALRGFENELRKVRDDGRITRAEIESLGRAVEQLAGAGVALDVQGFLDELTSKLNVASSKNGDDSTAVGGVLVSEADAGEHEYNEVLADGSHYQEDANDYLLTTQAGPHENQNLNFKAAESVKEAVADAKENIKAEVSNRELDMQRVTQEVSSATQLQSTLSKRWNDVGNSVLGNMRA